MASVILPQKISQFSNVSPRQLGRNRCAYSGTEVDERVSLCVAHPGQGDARVVVIAVHRGLSNLAHSDSIFSAVSPMFQKTGEGKIAIAVWRCRVSLDVLILSRGLAFRVGRTYHMVHKHRDPPQAQLVAELSTNSPLLHHDAGSTADPTLNTFVTFFAT